MNGGEKPDGISSVGMFTSATIPITMKLSRIINNVTGRTSEMFTRPLSRILSVAMLSSPCSRPVGRG
jgi:hypothetical protein